MIKLASLFIYLDFDVSVEFPEACQDKISEITCLRKSEQCENDFFMERYCRKTCGFCQEGGFSHFKTLISCLCSLKSSLKYFDPKNHFDIRSI